MSLFFRNKKPLLLTGALIAIMATIPATTGFASENSWATPFSAEASVVPVTPDQARAAMIEAMVQDEGQQVISTGDSSYIPAEAGDENVAVAGSELDSELECMAKVVHHEAANQSRAGQLAVAQLMMNRLRSGRFADTICGVANQPRQFFRTASYDPDRDTPQWATAVEVSREAREGASADVARGAIFYHAAYQATPRFFKTRQRIMTLGDHIFYR